MPRTRILKMERPTSKVTRNPVKPLAGIQNEEHSVLRRSFRKARLWGGLEHKTASKLSLFRVRKPEAFSGGFRLTLRPVEETPKVQN